MRHSATRAVPSIRAEASSSRASPAPAHVNRCRQLVPGTAGALPLNADGSYTYRLNNQDPDTDVLGAADRRRSIHVHLCAERVVRTDTIIVEVSGIDEPAQDVTSGSSTITFAADVTRSTRCVSFA